jgi:hypothetical protein
VANPAATDHRYLNIGTNYVTVDNGFFSASRNNSMSGFTVAGWIKLPNYTGDGNLRNIVGNYELGSIAERTWSILWDPTTNGLIWRVYFNASLATGSHGGADTSAVSGAI